MVCATAVSSVLERRDTSVPPLFDMLIRQGFLSRTRLSGPSALLPLPGDRTLCHSTTVTLIIDVTKTDRGSPHSNHGLEPRALQEPSLKALEVTVRPSLESLGRVDPPS